MKDGGHTCDGASVLIRPERPADVEAIFAVHEAAFGQTAEARLVEALRGTTSWIPELSLVAEREGRVIGHVLFTRMNVRDGDRLHAALALAPVGVLPASQNAGIGSALIRHGMDEARRLGHAIAIVLGHPSYYPRFGFLPAGRFEIRYPEPGHDTAFMVAELLPGALDGVHGVAEYAPAFAGV